jgi:hypothetical protein
VKKLAMCVGGGYSNKEAMVERKEVQGSDGTVHNFLHVSKNDQWLLNVILGAGAKRGSFKRSTIIDELKKKGEKPNTPEKTAVAAGEEEEDPMGALDEVQDEESVRPKKRYLARRCREVEVVVQMPRRCKLAQPNNEETVDVRIVNVGSNVVFIHEDDIPWFVQYLADEVGYGGVPVEDEDEKESAVGESGVPGLSVEWDFDSGDAWHATFTKGPLKGQSFTVRTPNSNRFANPPSPETGGQGRAFDGIELKGNSGEFLGNSWGPGGFLGAWDRDVFPEQG